MKTQHIIIGLILSLLSFSCSKDPNNGGGMANITPKLAVTGFVYTHEGSSSTGTTKAYIDMPLTLNVSLQNTAKNVKLQLRYQNNANSTGIMRYNGQALDQATPIAYETGKENDILTLTFTPSQTEIYILELQISTDGFATTQTLNLTFEAITPIFDVQFLEVPELIEVERPFDFNMLINEKYGASSHDVKVRASAKFTQGAGTVMMNGQDFPLTKGMDYTQAFQTDETLSLKDMILGDNPMSAFATKEGENVIQFQLVNEYDQAQYMILPFTAVLPAFEVKSATALKTQIYVGNSVPVEIAVRNDDHPTNFFDISYNLTLTTAGEPVTKAYSKIVEEGESLEAVAVKSELNARAADEAGIVRDTIDIPIDKPGDYTILLTITDKFKRSEQKEVKVRVTYVLLFANFSITSPVAVKPNRELPFTLATSDGNGGKDFLLEYSLEPAGAATLKMGGQGIAPNNKYKIGEQTQFVLTPSKAGTIKAEFKVSQIENDKVIGTVTHNFDFVSAANNLTAEITGGGGTLNVGDNAPLSLTVLEDGHADAFTVRYAGCAGAGTLSIDGQKYEVGQSFPCFHKQPFSMSYQPEETGAHQLTFEIIDGNGQQIVKTVSFDVAKNDAYFTVSSYNVNTLPGQGQPFTLTLQRGSGGGSFQVTVSGLKEGDNLTVNGNSYDNGRSFTITAGQPVDVQYKPYTYGKTDIEFSTAIGGVVFKKTVPFNCLASLSLESWYNGSVTNEGGTVYGGGNFEVGSQQIILAIPKTGFAFDGWYDYRNNAFVKVSDQERYTVTVDKSMTLQARFSKGSFSVSVQSNNDERGTVYGGGKFKFGDYVTVKAVPKPGFQFLNWNDGRGGSPIADNPYSFTMPAENLSLIAVFSNNSYTISVTATEGGQATGAGAYETNANCRITALADNGYSYAGLYDGQKLVTLNNPYNFTVTRDRSFEARFTKNKYEITVSATTGGTATGTGVHEFGRQVTLRASAVTGYEFDGFYDGENKLSADAQFMYTVPASNKTIVAKFVPAKFTITVTAGEGGTATGGGQYAYGTTQLMRATANPGFSIDGWYDGNTKLSSNAEFEYTIPAANKTLTARFKSTPYELSLVATVGGSAAGGGTYTYNSDVSLEGTPATGYRFVCWQDQTGAVVSTENPYAFKMPAKDLSYTASFELKKYGVALSSETGGKVYGNGTYEHGSNCMASAIPDMGYEFDGWYKNGIRVSAAASYTFKVEQETALVGKFKLKKFRVTLVGTSGGTVSGDGTFDYGSSQTVTAVPNDTYQFEGWYDLFTDELVSNQRSYTFNIPSSDVYLKAKFSKSSLTVSVTAGAGGTASGGGSYAYNSDCRVTAVPATGYAFSGWYENGVRISGANPYTFSVQDNRIIQAQFKADQHTLYLDTETNVAMTGGSVTGDGSYDYNSQATITATTNKGFTFVGWYENGVQVSSATTMYVTMTENKTLTAKFTVNSYGLNLVSSPEGAGYLKASNNQSSYTFGTRLTISASPYPGYEFVRWDIPVEPLEPGGQDWWAYSGQAENLPIVIGAEQMPAYNNMTVTRGEPNTYIAVFRKIYCGIGYGYNTNECTIEDQGNYYGEEAYIECFPKPGYRFIGFFKKGIKEPLSTENPWKFKIYNDLEGIEVRCEKIE